MKFPAPAVHVQTGLEVQVQFARRRTFAVTCKHPLEVVFRRSRQGNAGAPHAAWVIVPAGDVAFVEKCDIVFVGLAG